MIKKKIRDAILLALEKTVDGFVEFSEFYDNPRRYVWYGPPYVKKSALSSAIARLREKGFIEKQKNEGKIIFKLTDLGRDWIMKNQSEDQIEWDGVWRLVVFDIPEKHRRVRNILRRRLKEWGFTVWQKSVWATKKPLTDALRKLIKDLKVEDWVLVIESDNTGK